MRLLLLLLFLLQTSSAFAQEDGIPRFVRFFGRLHPMVLHVPIGLLAGVALLELIAMIRRSDRFTSAINVMLPIAALLGIATALFGLFLSWEPGYDTEAISWHKWTGISAAAFAGAALVLHQKNKRSPKRAFLNGYRSSLFACVAAIIIAGHFGGSITHGREFLFEYMPFVPAKKEEPASSQVRDEYVEIIQPIFAKYCYSCHGPDRQRSGLRLDEMTAAFEGGKSGMPGIVPEDIFSSAVAERILLPRDDESAMPPPAKAGLSAEETIAVIHWIQRGAAWADDK